MALSWEPLFRAGLIVSAHAIAAIGAFVIGVVQLIAPKGTAPHRALGWIWTGLMAVVLVTSLGIQELAHTGVPSFYGFSPIHLFTVFTAVVLPLGVAAARRGDVTRHRRHMTGLFFGALLIAGAFTFLPGRVMHAVVFGAG